MSSAAGDREQKMLDSTTQNLSERLTEVRKTLGTLITKVRCNFNYLTDRAALLGGPQLHFTAITYIFDFRWKQILD